ncbi:uncharacterized protein N7477_001284 [Penicillium maclennaniae]|uniref:uncharacterized protein n=1 Tax=Penicillium maclennaniae TaxID=1343394 RepID=UPI0025400996|nr:uncharacterized protein N7477_001284 [Penicillium maclennaniae]KAJ5681344.1 hypothetical protein N7477_001284 [Penicillium maclennaniae]
MPQSLENASVTQTRKPLIASSAVSTQSPDGRGNVPNPAQQATLVGSLETIVINTGRVPARRRRLVWIPQHDSLAALLGLRLPRCVGLRQ